MAKPRKPTPLLVLSGGLKGRPQRAAKRANEPEPNGPIGDAPEHFTPVQKAAWDDLVNTCHAGVLCRADRVFLEITATLLARYRTVGAKDTRLASRVEIALGKLGMTPAERSRVSAIKPKALPAGLEEFTRKES